jgi:hypothetical protein
MAASGGFFLFGRTGGAAFFGGAVFLFGHRGSSVLFADEVFLLGFGQGGGSRPQAGHDGQQREKKEPVSCHGFEGYQPAGAVQAAALRP